MRDVAERYGRLLLEVDREWKDALKEFQKQVQIPGYRAGRAPIPILERRFAKEIEDAVRGTFDLRPAAIVRDLDLKRPIYQQTAAYGHFGRNRPDFTWEHLSRLDAFTSAVGLG